MPFSFTFYLIAHRKPATITVNCIKSTKSLKFSRNCLKYQVCQKQIHLKCSKLNKQGFLEFTRDTISFTYHFCLDYCYLQCNKHVYYSQKGVLCSGCDNWIHQKRAGLTSLEYKMLFQENNNDTWFCRCCKKDMFPFFDLTNTQFFNFLESNSPCLVSNNSNLTDCSICQKINSKKSRLKSTVCKSIIHKKCSKLQTKEIIDLKTTKPYTWEFLLCLPHKFPFSALTDHEIVFESFDSSFNCVFQINLSSDIKENKNKYIFKYCENDTTKDSNILDKNDNKFEKL